MKRAKVTFRPQAETDLFELYRYIAEDAGHEVAGRYIDRIEATCLALETFPKRGTPRDDDRPGLRTKGFERRAMILFHVTKAEVTIVRILYGGREYEGALQDTSGE